MSLQLCNPLYHVEEWIGTYETKLVIILAHDLFAAEDTQPPGEEFEQVEQRIRGLKLGSVRLTLPISSIPLAWVDRLLEARLSADWVQDTDIKYQPKGTQVCGRCGKSVYNKLSYPNQPRLKAWDEIELTLTGTH